MIHVRAARGRHAVDGVAWERGESSKTSDAKIAGVEIAGAGFGLHWPARDADVTLRGLMNGVFGTRAWMSELARRAGRTTSPAKAVTTSFYSFRGFVASRALKGGPGTRRPLTR